MDLYAMIKIVHTVEKRSYEFGLPWAAPYEEVYNALAEIGAKVAEMEENGKKLSEKQAQEAAAQEPAKTDTTV